LISGYGREGDAVVTAIVAGGEQGADDMALTEVRLPPVQPDEVRVRVRYAGSTSWT
jgi:NADPH:quinone reductase-like Zn-dependent oxidoreductase